MPQNHSAVRVENLKVAYDQNGNEALVAVDGLSMDVKRGEFVSIIGPTGAGKTSVLKVLCGLQLPVSGIVQIEGLSPAEARKQKKFSVMFQQPGLLPWRTVRGNILLPEELGGRTNAESKVDDLIDLVGLGDFANYYPNDLSAGMAQRVALARAVNSGGSVILMDEPFSQLDEFTRSRLHLELQKIWMATRPSIVFVTHSISEAIFLSDRIFAFTHRPAQVRDCIEIPFPRPRDPRIRDSVEFVQLVRQISRLLEFQE